MAGWLPKWFGESSAQLPWGDIPELSDVPPARAWNAYQRANDRLRWGRAWWAALLASTLALVSILIVNVVSTRAFGSNGAFYWIRSAFLWILAGLAVRLFYTITHRTLRRYVRAELGTHCSRCDYDLRGTADAIPPDVARCPECGKPIPRNVHRQTIPGDAASDPAAAALLRRNGED